MLNGDLNSLEEGLNNNSAGGAAEEGQAALLVGAEDHSEKVASRPSLLQRGRSASMREGAAQLAAKAWAAIPSPKKKKKSVENDGVATKLEEESGVASLLVKGSAVDAASSAEEAPEDQGGMLPQPPPPPPKNTKEKKKAKRSSGVVDGERRGNFLSNFLERTNHEEDSPSEGQDNASEPESGRKKNSQSSSSLRVSIPVSNSGDLRRMEEGQSGDSITGSRAGTFVADHAQFLLGSSFGRGSSRNEYKDDGSESGSLSAMEQGQARGSATPRATGYPSSASSNRPQPPAPETRRNGQYRALPGGDLTEGSDIFNFDGDWSSQQVAGTALFFGLVAFVGLFIDQDVTAFGEALTGSDNKTAAFAAATAFLVLTPPLLALLAKAGYDLFTKEDETPRSAYEKVVDAKNAALKALHNSPAHQVGAFGLIVGAGTVTYRYFAEDEASWQSMVVTFLVLGGGSYLAKAAWNQHFRAEEQRNAAKERSITPPTGTQVTHMVGALKQLKVSLEDSSPVSFTKLRGCIERLLRKSYDRDTGAIAKDIDTGELSESLRNLALLYLQERTKQNVNESTGEASEEIEFEENDPFKPVFDDLKALGLDIQNPWDSFKALIEREQTTSDAFEAYGYLAKRLTPAAEVRDDQQETQMDRDSKYIRNAYTDSESLLLNRAMQAVNALSDNLKNKAPTREDDALCEQVIRVYREIKEVRRIVPAALGQPRASHSGLFNQNPQNPLTELMEGFNSLLAEIDTHENPGAAEEGATRSVSYAESLRTFMREEGALPAAEENATSASNIITDCNSV